MDQISLTPQIWAFNGDCFAQRCWLKTIHATSDYNDLFEEELAETAADITKGYGTLIGIVTENKYNHHMRYELGGNLFYPATGHGDIGIFAFEPLDQPESNFYNNGYIRHLGPRQLAGYDPQQYYGIEEFITRFQYSEVQTIQGLEDQYRRIPSGHQRDFDLQYGPMVRVIADGNRLISVQHRAINSHPIQERAYAQGTEGSNTLLGTVNELTDFVVRLSDRRGSQHKMSVQKGDTGIYGVDANKRTIWRARGNEVEFISETKEVSTLVHKILEQVTQCSDRSSFLQTIIYVGLEYMRNSTSLTMRCYLPSNLTIQICRITPCTLAKSWIDSSDLLLHRIFICVSRKTSSAFLLIVHTCMISAIATIPFMEWYIHR